MIPQFLLVLLYLIILSIEDLLVFFISFPNFFSCRVFLFLFRFSFSLFFFSSLFSPRPHQSPPTLSLSTFRHPAIQRRRRQTLGHQSF